MARISKSLTLAGALFAASGAAYPMKRDKVVVWETITDVVWTTVEVTTTVTLPPAPVTTAITTPANAPQTVTATVVPAQPPQKPSEPADTPVVSTPSVAPAPEQPSNSPPPAPTTPVVPSPPLPTVSPPEESSSTTPSAPSAPTSTGGGGGHHPVPPPNPPSTGYSGPCSESNHCTGEVTYYDTATLATHPGSCGGTSNGRSENVLALPQALMDQADCGRTVTVKYGGIEATGVVVDKCMGCDSTSIDLSRHFFAQIADLAVGRIGGVEWWIH